MGSLLMRRLDLWNLPPLPRLPDGIHLRKMTQGDIPAVATVLDRAFADEDWDAARVTATLWVEPSVKQTLVIDLTGQPIATASARLKPDQFPGSGYLHWVAVDPAHSGNRLGYAISLAVLHTFAALDCADAVLETQDHRLAAIKTYLNLGFVPEHRDPTHADRWVIIQAALR